MNTMSAFDLKGKKGLVLGLANEHSIAWGCARQAQAMGPCAVCGFGHTACDLAECHWCDRFEVGW